MSHYPSPVTRHFIAPSLLLGIVGKVPPDIFEQAPANLDNPKFNKADKPFKFVFLGGRRVS